MNTCEVFRFMDEQGRTVGHCVYDPKEAQEIAKSHNWKCIVDVFVFDHSQTMWDYTVKDPIANLEEELRL